ncbi:hypothetical protein ACIOJD_05820 [Streptomyces sp. NPDC088116]|uniref:hypothetical protein n=1 Tax=Streptomyces sp. NPDC088116 TaxID=3365825 RepID=UPI00381E8CCD
MRMSGWMRGGLSLAAVAVLAGVAGCQGDGGAEKGASDSETARSRSGATDAVTAAYEKTSAAKSARVRMTVSMPASVGVGGDMEMSGVMGWDPTVMDMTMNGSALAAASDTPGKIRTVWLDNAVYMDLGAATAKSMKGKSWLKLDMGALDDASGDAGLGKQLMGGLENVNQDPARQLALLLDSPNLKHVGAEKVDGVRAEHYKGTLTLDELMKSDGSLDVLGAKDRKALVDMLRKSGMKGYGTEVWVNEDDYPVRMDVGTKTSQGTVKVSAHYSDYGAKAQVQAPPTGETFDVAELLGELRAGAGTGAASGS